MMRIAICDDVAADRRAIAEALHSYLANRAIEAEVETFSRPDRLMKVARDKVFDLYLLDVLLSEEMTGIDLVRNLRAGAAKVPVIFFSTSREYAVDAFAVEAISYLKKPWTMESFTRVMDLATEAYRKSQDGLLSFKTSGGVFRIHGSQIEYVTTASTVNYVTIRIANGVEITVRDSVRNFAEQYHERVYLFSAGRSILVNPAQISSVGKSSVTFFSGATLEVPRSVMTTLAKEVLSLSYPCNHLT